MKRILLFSLLFSAMQITAFARDAGWDEEEDTCCFFSDCVAIPRGSFKIQLKGGVAPGLYTHRTVGFITSPIAQLINFETFQKLPDGECLYNFGLLSPQAPTELPVAKFNSFYKTPWIVGIEIGYAICDNAIAYFEAIYRQAKNSVFKETDSVSISTTACRDKFKQASFCIGCRLYTNRFLCETTSLFAGTKFGWSKRGGTVCVNSTIVKVPFYNTTPGEVVSGGAGGVPFFEGDLFITGGGHIGLDISIWNCLSFVITFEVVPSCERATPTNIKLDPIINAGFINAFGATDFQLGHTGIELAFPVTFGFALRF